MAALAAALALLVLSGQASVEYLMLPPATYAALRLSRASQAALEAKVGERTADLARTRMRLVETQELSRARSCSARRSPT